MPIRFYNTLTRRKEDFEPLHPPRVGMYTCGPTVYNFAHIGNLRTFLFEDLLRRYLRFRGYEVTHVMNLTDVEDKIIRSCRETGESLQSLTARYAQAFFEDIVTLGMERADHYPAATGHIPEIVAMVKSLLEKGHAYVSNGSVYFQLSSFPEYGRLSHFDIDQLQTGASGRVDTDEYETQDARDFALWKAWDEEDGEVYWETELGKGRPGWHIECSAMSMKYLGQSFDIHCGGIDNMFPHHENEIAQSEACTGHPFVRYWLHSAHLVVDNKKMSKSLGNFYTLRDLLGRGYDPLAIRWVLMATHYRQPSNFTFDALEAARESLRRIADFRVRMEESRPEAGESLESEAKACETAFIEALDDDLNISGALAAVFDFIRQAHRAADDYVLSSEGARRAIDLLDQLNCVTGLFAPVSSEEAPAEVTELVRQRSEARKARDYAGADRIRAALAELGWSVEDTPDGPRVKRLM